VKDSPAPTTSNANNKGKYGFEETFFDVTGHDLGVSILSLHGFRQPWGFSWKLPATL
jgi:hypothetical protein